MLVSILQIRRLRPGPPSMHWFPLLCSQLPPTHPPLPKALHWFPREGPTPKRCSQGPLPYTGFLILKGPGCRVQRRREEGPNGQNPDFWLASVRECQKHSAG